MRQRNTQPKVQSCSSLSVYLALINSIVTGYMRSRIIQFSMKNTTKKINNNTINNNQKKKGTLRFTVSLRFIFLNFFITYKTEKEKKKR